MHAFCNCIVWRCRIVAAVVQNKQHTQHTCDSTSLAKLECQPQVIQAPCAFLLTWCLV